MVGGRRKSFGVRFFALVLIGIPLSFYFVLLVGTNPALDDVLKFPLFLLPWPNHPLVKIVLLANAAIWGFGVTYLVFLCTSVVIRIRRHHASSLNA